MWLILPWLWSCHRSTSPDLVAEVEGLRVWEEGRAHWERGEFSEAAVLFSRANAENPHAVLLAWEGMARWHAGEEDAARVLLMDAVVRDPTLVEARYNLALLHAQAGDLDRAGVELHAAMVQGEMAAGVVFADADFSPYLAHPAFSFLPKNALNAEIHAGPQELYKGSLWVVVAEFDASPGATVSVKAAATAAPVVLLDISEDQLSAQRRRITWVYRVLGAGAWALDSLTLKVGDWEASGFPLHAEAFAPAGPAPSWSPLVWETPRALLGDRPIPNAWVDGSHLWAVFPHGASLETQVVPQYCGSWREEDVLLWRVCRFPQPVGPIPSIVRGSERLWGGAQGGNAPR